MSLMPPKTIFCVSPFYSVPLPAQHPSHITLPAPTCRFIFRPDPLRRGPSFLRVPFFIQYPLLLEGACLSREGLFLLIRINFCLQVKYILFWWAFGTLPPKVSVVNLADPCFLGGLSIRTDLNFGAFN